MSARGLPLAPARLSGAQAGVAGFASVLAIGALISGVCARHPAALPVWAPWTFSWTEYLAAVCAIWCYVRGVLRLPAALRPPVRRRLLFLGGVTLIWLVLQTRFDYWAQHMFFIDRIRHIATHHLGPFLIALAMPGQALEMGLPAPAGRLAARLARSLPARALRQPVAAASIFAGLVVFWLIPPIEVHAMLDPLLYDVMNWSMVIDGSLFWCLVMDPRPAAQAGLSYVARGAAAFGVMFPMMAAGTVIGAARHDLYVNFSSCGRLLPWIAPLQDQQIGGLIIWVPAGAISALAVMLIARHQFQEDDRISRLLLDRAGR